METTEPSPALADAVRTQLARNLARVRERIERACAHADRPPDSVRLIAVTKQLAPWATALLAELGALDLGENRVQRLADKVAYLRAHAAARPRWHMIGHLQRRKVGPLLALGPACVHSVDSLRLLEALERRVPDGERLAILLQVNVSGEPQKHGFAPAALPEAIERVRDCERLEARGLMTMAPQAADEATLHAVFGGLRALLERHRTALPSLRELSMGMSGDLEIAIAEGASWVRVGSALCEGLPAAARWG